jgi:hypothetical protein
MVSAALMLLLLLLLAARHPLLHHDPTARCACQAVLGLAVPAQVAGNAAYYHASCLTSAALHCGASGSCGSNELDEHPEQVLQMHAGSSL